MLLSKLFFSGSLYKPQAVKALKDFLQVPDTVNEPQRVSTLCKLLHCRSTGSSTTDSNDHSFSFELFVTDASLQYVTKSVGSFDGFLPYLKITGKSSQVLPSELRAAPTSCGMNLSAKHLLLKAQGTCAVRYTTDLTTSIKQKTYSPKILERVLLLSFDPILRLVFVHLLGHHQNSVM